MLGVQESLRTVCVVSVAVVSAVGVEWLYFTTMGMASGFCCC